MPRPIASLLLATLFAACAGEAISPRVAPTVDGGLDRGVAADLALPAAPSPDLAPMPPVDDATIVSATLPAKLACGARFSAEIVVHNAGSTSWTRPGGYKLGAVGDSDPLHGGDPRVWLDDATTVAPGADFTFVVPLVAPAQAGTYATDWQMVHEGVRWFGAVASQAVVVECAPADPFDLAQATILNSPADVASWPATAKITTLDLQASGVFVDFTKKNGPDSWPDVPFGAPGDSLEYTLWIVLDIDGKWYASGCIEYWRGLDRNGGPPSGYAMNWYYDAIRWGPMVGHQPAIGERVGFLVTAGDARNDGDAIVKERSDVVFVEFPTDAGAVFTF